MVDETESAENKENLDRARLARERRDAEQRKRLDELRAHAAAAQAQREKRDEDRVRRQAEQRARDDARRLQVEERKRAIWEASVSRREALLQREQDRSERLERARAQRNLPRSAFAFGSSTPRLLEPDCTGFWAARSTNPKDQMNFFESLAASTTNVMFASSPLRRGASVLHLDCEIDTNKDESDRQPQPMMWSSVARRRTDLVPTLPAPRAPGRAYSMTRLDKIPSQRPLHSASPSMHHLNRTQTRSGETTPGSRPGSAMSTATGGVVRRANSGLRKQRPTSIAGTGVNTPRGGGDTLAQSVASTPSVSRDGTVAGTGVAGTGDAPRRPLSARRPRPVSMHVSRPQVLAIPNPADGKPPVHRKPKPSKDENKMRASASPGRMLSPSPGRAISPSLKEPSVPKDVPKLQVNQVSAVEVTQKLEALQIQNGQEPVNTPSQNVVEKMNGNKSTTEASEKDETVEETAEPKSEKKDAEKPIDSEMTASMTARRITTEEEAKAALAERRRRAREELERQAELEKQRLQREAEEEAERQRQEEERHRREEEEARELAQLQRRLEEEKLQKAIEAQQQLEREEAERKIREESERQARLKEDEEKRRAAEEAERLRREEAEREEKERLARKQRVEAIMARTRLRKQAEENNKSAAAQALPGAAEAPAGDNGNAAGAPQPQPLLADSATSQIEDNTTVNSANANANANAIAPAETNNGNMQPTSNVGHISSIQTGMSAEHKKIPENVDFTAHNGHGAAHSHPLTLQNAI